MKNKHEPKNTFVLLTVEDFFTEKRKNGVLSMTTAAVIWGFSPVLLQKIDMTFPISKVSTDIKNNKNNFRILQQVEERYNEGINVINWDGKKIRVYSPERTIVELIKEYWTNLDDVVIETIRNFFKDFEYDSKELDYFAKLFNVQNEVKFARGLING